ncbi:MAG: tetratricopeptide repeat protein [Sphingomonas sp.]|nr:tetratricopeptide repeat protein [Sphingomonas sp.]
MQARLSTGRRRATIVFAAALALGGLAPAAGQADVPPVEEPGEDAITVTGARDEPVRTDATGSRILRNDEGIGFLNVATRTGVAGLVPGSGMDPFAGGTRVIREISCRADDPRMSPDAACRLHAVQQLLAAGAHDEARSALDRFLASEDVADEERYIAAGLWYRLGELTGDPLDREDALLAMLRTAAMPGEERVAALRTLAALALRRDRRLDAAGYFEQVLPLARDDARSRANLAGIYAELGRAEEAAGLVAEAIAIVRARGEPVPDEWLAFAAGG